MNETELERMVVRIVGDNTHYQKTLRETVNSTIETAKVMQSQADAVKSYGSAVSDFMMTTAAAITAVGATKLFDKLLYDMNILKKDVDGASESWGIWTARLGTAIAAASSMVLVIGRLRDAFAGLSIAQAASSVVGVWGSVLGIMKYALTAIVAVGAAIVTVKGAIIAFAAAVVAVPLFFMFRKWWIASRDLQKRLNADLDAVKGDSAEAADTVAINLEKMSKTHSGTTRAGLIAEDFAEARARIQQLEPALAQAVKFLDAIRRDASDPGNLTGLSLLARRAQNRVDTLREQLESARNLSSEYAEEHDYTSGYTGREAVKQMKEDLKEELFLVGKVGDEAKLAKIEFEMMGHEIIAAALHEQGLTQEAEQFEYRIQVTQRLIGGLRKQMEELDKAKALQKMGDDAVAFRDHLVSALDAVGKSANQAKLDALVKQNAKLGGDMDFGGIKRLIDANEWEENNKKFKTGAEELAKHLRTPLEVYTDRVQELTVMLDYGYISQELYGAAVEEATKKLEEQEKVARGVHHELSKIEAVSLGSAEHLSKLQNYLFDSRRVGEQGDGKTAVENKFGPGAENPFKLDNEKNENSKEQVDILKEINKNIQQMRDDENGRAEEPFVIAGGINL